MSRADAARMRKRALVTGLAVCFLVLASGARAGTPAYRDTGLPFAERAADLVARMTLAEKAAQLTSTNAPAIPRLGVQEYAYWSEALHGVNAFWGGDATSPTGVDIDDVRATSFPTNLSLSLAWDPALTRRETDAISDEARGFLDPSLFGSSQNNLGPQPGAYGSLFYFAPTVNMLRDPRWGRTDEGFGEDPFLAGSLGAAWVDGFQGQTANGELRDRYLKAVTTLKHFALNNVENNRQGVSSNTDEGTIRDYYTAQFRAIIEQAHATGAMSSYNAINGTPAVSNDLALNVLLRRTFGFDGYVTSDCGAVGTQYRANDPDNPLAQNPATAALATSGHDWAPPGWSTDHAGQLARWTELDGPLSINARSGAEAWSLRAGTALNCVGDPGQTGHPAFWDALRPVFSDENKLSYVNEAIAAGVLDEGVIDRRLLPVFVQRMRSGEFDPRRRQAYTKIGKGVIESGAHRRLAQRVAEQTLTLLQNRRPDGAERLLPVDPEATDEVVVVGDQAGTVFLGQYSGDPTEQVSLREGIERVFRGAHVTYDDAGSSTTATAPPALRPATAEAVRDADLVVVMVGTDEKVMTEGYDRKTLELPGNYEELIDAVAALGNPRIVLVDQSAGPVDLREVRGKVAAILFSAANGQRQGIAAARAIAGDVSPSGHLSFTWYSGDDQLPAMDDYDLTPRQTGGLGRTYMYFTRRPEWPFGFGLGYTRFRYSEPTVNRARMDAGGTVRVSFEVENIGNRPGADVAQLYARPPHRAADTAPRQRLVGFERTRLLDPGTSERITIRVPLTRSLRSWSPARRREVVQRGRWQFRLGHSSRDIAGTVAVQVTGSIPRRVATVALDPPTLTLRPGDRLDLRGRNPWLDGIAPARYEREGSTIISAVRRDDSFVDLDQVPVRFASGDEDVLRVNRHGILRAVAPGVATITVTVGDSSASTPFVVTAR